MGFARDERLPAFAERVPSYGQGEAVQVERDRESGAGQGSPAVLDLALDVVGELRVDGAIDEPQRTARRATST
jgi:hypothetical protein